MTSLDTRWARNSLEAYTNARRMLGKMERSAAGRLLPIPFAKMNDRYDRLLAKLDKAPNAIELRMMVAERRELLWAGRDMCSPVS